MNSEHFMAGLLWLRNDGRFHGKPKPVCKLGAKQSRHNPAPNNPDTGKRKRQWR